MKTINLLEIFKYGNINERKNELLDKAKISARFPHIAVLKVGVIDLPTLTPTTKMMVFASRDYGAL